MGWMGRKEVGVRHSYIFSIKPLQIDTHNVVISVKNDEKDEILLYSLSFYCPSFIPLYSIFAEGV